MYGFTEWENEQVEYNHLINKQRNLKISIKAKRKQMHHSFLKLNKKKVLLLDFLFALFILFNIGALMITNALVMKNTKIELKEANPIASKNYGFQSTNNYAQYFGIITHILLLATLIGYYLYNRWQIHDQQTYTTYLTLTILIGTMLTYDFLNDLGYLIGKIIFQ